MRVIYLCGTRGRDLFFERVTYDADDRHRPPYPIQLWRCRVCNGLDVGPKEGPFGHVCPEPLTPEQHEELVRLGMVVVHRLLDRTG
jgi:hypothetical protein